MAAGKCMSKRKKSLRGREERPPPARAARKTRRSLKVEAEGRAQGAGPRAKRTRLKKKVSQVESARSARSSASSGSRGSGGSKKAARSKNVRTVEQRGLPPQYMVYTVDTKSRRGTSVLKCSEVMMQRRRSIMKSQGSTSTCGSRTRARERGRRSLTEVGARASSRTASRGSRGSAPSRGASKGPAKGPAKGSARGLARGPARRPPMKSKRKSKSRGEDRKTGCLSASPGGLRKRARSRKKRATRNAR